MNKRMNRTWFIVSIVIVAVLGIFFSAIISGLLEGSMVNTGHFAYEEDVNTMMNILTGALAGMFIVGFGAGLLLKRKVK